jgi:hypothetical protein
MNGPRFKGPLGHKDFARLLREFGIAFAIVLAVQAVAVWWLGLP